MSTRWASVAEVLREMADLPEFVELPPPSVNSVGSAKSTPLHIAAVWGDTDAIDLLVAAGASLNARGEHGYSPLHEAAEQGHLSAVRRLVELGASKAALNDDGVTPLQVATSVSNHEVVDFLSRA